MILMSLEEAKAALSTLIDDARSGKIIPVRLAGQLEALLALLQQAEAEQQAAPEPQPAPPAGDGSAATVMAENAEFMKTAIHELRNPMTSIRGYSDMLNNPDMSGELNAMQQQLLDVVRANTRRMEDLLSDMSYINKIRAGILLVEEKMDMFKNIAQMAEKRARPLAEELNRQLEFDIPQGLPLLMTDGEHFAHALFKLIENGLRYSPEGEGKVIVSARAEGSDLIVLVEDNGIGMTPDEIAQLGTLYFRSDEDAVRAFKGSGLGIPIVFGLVDLLKGDIRVESEPGKGTKFTLMFKGMT